MIDLETTARKFLHVVEVAEIAGCSRRTVYNWINAGKLSYIQVIANGAHMIPIEDVRKALTPRLRTISSVRVQPVQITH